MLSPLWAQTRPRAERRAHLQVADHLGMLDDDVDAFERAFQAALERVDNRISRIQAYAVGILISTTGAAIILAINLIR